MLPESLLGSLGKVFLLLLITCLVPPITAHGAACQQGAFHPPVHLSRYNVIWEQRSGILWWIYEVLMIDDDLTFSLVCSMIRFYVLEAFPTQRCTVFLLGDLYLSLRGYLCADSVWAKNMFGLCIIL